LGFGVDHIGIAVSKIEQALGLYCDVLGLNLDDVYVVEEQRVKVAFLSTGGETRLELLEPLDRESPVAKFIERRGEGVHHITLKVRNIEAVLQELRNKGLRLIDEKPRKGAEGSKIAFIHPKSTGNVLIELRE